MSETTTTTPPPFGGWTLPENARQDPPLAFRASHFVLMAPGQLKDLAREITAARPDLHLATVTVGHPRTNNRHHVMTLYRGPRQHAIERAAYQIATATCTEQYEHMLPTLASVAYPAPGEISICIHTNLSAGD